MPCKLGAGGIEKIYEISLTDEETAALRKSAGAVQELVDVIKSRWRKISVLDADKIRIR